MARKIAFINQKGGVGKTTTAIQFAAWAVARGKRVLAVDMDPQGNFTFNCGIDTEDENTVTELLLKECTFAEAVRRVQWTSQRTAGPCTQGAEGDGASGMESLSASPLSKGLSSENSQALSSPKQVGNPEPLARACSDSSPLCAIQQGAGLANSSLGGAGASLNNSKGASGAPGRGDVKDSVGQGPQLGSVGISTEGTQGNSAGEHRGWLDVLPSDLALGGHEMQLSAKAGRERLLWGAIKDVEAEYDYIVIDCPPALNIFVYNSLYVADQIVIVTQAETFAILGIKQILDVVKDFNESLCKNISVAGMVITMFNPNTKTSKELIPFLEGIGEKRGFKVIGSKISKSVKITEAQSQQKSIFEYAPKSKQAEEYDLAFVELDGYIKNPRPAGTPFTKGGISPEGGAK